MFFLIKNSEFIDRTVKTPKKLYTSNDKQ